MILILGSANDPHLSLVGSALRDLGAEHRLLDHDARTPLSLGLPNTTLRLEGEKIDLEAVSLVWSRAKVLYQHYGDGESYRNQFLWGRGWRAFFDEFAAIMGERVVNSAESVRRSSDKLGQLRAAARLGARVPDTLVSNDPDEIRAWGTRFPSIITKALGDASVPDLRKLGGQSSLMTTRVDWDLFGKSGDGVRVFPAVYQAEVPKRTELRVAVQGRSLFAFSIDSQAREYTKVDWRFGTQLPIFARYELPDDVSDFCFRYLKTYGLFAGHFDFIVTPDGEYVFLECNPQGQWAWLDQLSGYAMSEAFARELVERASVRSPARTEVQMA